MWSSRRVGSGCQVECGADGRFARAYVASYMNC